MSFYPDGETRIPEQTPVPGAGAPPEDPVRRRTRLLVRTAVINGVVLVAAVVLAYVLPVTDDPDVALGIVVGAAVLTALHMTVVLLADQRRTQQQGAAGTATARPASADAGGPAPVTAHPYGAVAAEPAPPATGAFSMPVEDVFSITGRGTVVTGRVASGQLRVGQRVTVVREGQARTSAEVTAIEQFRRTPDVAAAGENVGLLLAGVAKHDVARGDVLQG